MSFFAAVGIFITASIAVFALLFATYQVTKRLRKKAPTPTIDPKGMPYLRPIPIPTANSPFGMRTLVWFFEIRRWVLTENWRYRLKDGTEIILPADFEFDGASIPRIFWGILSPVGLLLIPGLIHDYGYKYNQLWELTGEGQVRPYPGAGQEPGKVLWDKLFREVAKDVNGFWLINAVAWLAVAVGGNGTWRRHREADAKPDEPRVVQS